MNPRRSDLKERKSKKMSWRDQGLISGPLDCKTKALPLSYWLLLGKRVIMTFYHHYQCSFKLSFCHLEILKKILIFSKISHWISIFSIITIYSYHKRIPDGLKIVPYLFWVVSPILYSVRKRQLVCMLAQIFDKPPTHPYLLT